MATVEIEQRNQIARLCSYISDDKTIANFIGVPVAMVRKIRATIPKANIRKPVIPLDHDNRVENKSKRLGSDALNKAMWNYYAVRAMRGRVTPLEAAVLYCGMLA